MLSEEEILLLFSQVCLAVDFLHNRVDRPIIHRDITPMNILISKKGLIKLSDFGISSQNKYTKGRIGVRQYMAPEFDD